MTEPPDQTYPPLTTQIRYSMIHAVYTPHPLLFMMCVLSFVWVFQMLLLAAGEVAPSERHLLLLLDEGGWPHYLPFVVWWIVFTLYTEALFLPYRRLKRFATLTGGGLWIANAAILLQAEALSTPMTWYSIVFALTSFWAYLRVGRVQDISGADYELIAKERRRRERRNAGDVGVGGEDRTDGIAKTERPTELDA